MTDELAGNRWQSLRSERAALLQLIEVYEKTSLEQSSRLEVALSELQTALEVAEQASRAKSQFFAQMSHELRTPLNAIIGYSEMLQEEEARVGSSRFEADLNRITAAGRHLLQLINGLLDLSRIEAEKMDVQLEKFEPKAVFGEVLQICVPLIAKNGNSLRTDVDENLGAIYSDPTKLRQCLLNLMSNAAEFTNNGTISLGAKREGAGDTCCLVISVRDSGIGMTPEQIARLFEAFYQADPGSIRTYGGAGLGLHITHRFCEMLGGRISVESVLDEGSLFTIRLPYDSRPFVDSPDSM